jgi:hypothetical protein
MSQVSVEVRAMAEAVNSGDLEAFLARTAEDVEFTSLVAEADVLGVRGSGKLGWWAFFRTEHEVLEAAGLRE